MGRPRGGPTQKGLTAPTALLTGAQTPSDRCWTFCCLSCPELVSHPPPQPGSSAQPSPGNPSPCHLVSCLSKAGPIFTPAARSSPEPTRRPPAAQRATWQLHVGFPSSMMGLHPLPREGRVPWALPCTVNPSLTGATFEHFTTTPQAQWPLGRAHLPQGHLLHHELPGKPSSREQAKHKDALGATPSCSQLLRTPLRGEPGCSGGQSRPLQHHHRPLRPLSEVLQVTANPSACHSRHSKWVRAPRERVRDGGFSKTGALGHTVPWPVLGPILVGARSFPASQAVGLSLWKKAARLQRGGERREVILISRGLTVPTQLKSQELQVV